MDYETFKALINQSIDEHPRINRIEKNVRSIMGILENMTTQLQEIRMSRLIHPRVLARHSDQIANHEKRLTRLEKQAA